jgi:hypothetical protein
MYKVTIALGALVLLAACESGWDVAGHVITKDVPDHHRPLYVFVAETELADPDPTTWQLSPVRAAAEIPADGVDYRFSDLGCPAGGVAVVVWVPAKLPEHPPDHFDYTFTPAAGDYVARSTVVHPRCGWSTRVARVDLTLRR